VLSPAILIEARLDVSDIVIELPVTAGPEADLFGQYFQRFVDKAFIRAATSDEEAPMLMLRSDPLQDREVKVVIFQERDMADAFTQGWSLVRGSGSKETA
jgi:hypothetical protein